MALRFSTRTFTSLLLLLLWVGLPAVCAAEVEALDPSIGVPIGLSPVSVSPVLAPVGAVPVSYVPSSMVSPPPTLWPPSSALPMSMGQRLREYTHHMQGVAARLCAQTPSLLSFQSFVQMSESTSAYMAMPFTKNHFVLGMGLWQALPNDDARALLLAMALQWLQANGPHRAERTGALATATKATLTTGLLDPALLVLALPVWGLAGADALAYQRWLTERVDAPALATVVRAGYNPQQALELFGSLYRIRPLTFMSQNPKSFNSGVQYMEHRSSGYNPDQYRHRQERLMALLIKQNQPVVARAPKLKPTNTNAQPSGPLLPANTPTVVAGVPAAPVTTAAATTTATAATLNNHLLPMALPAQPQPLP